MVPLLQLPEILKHPNHLFLLHLLQHKVIKSSCLLLDIPIKHLLDTCIMYHNIYIVLSMKKWSSVIERDGVFTSFHCFNITKQCCNSQLLMFWLLLYLSLALTQRYWWYFNEFNILHWCWQRVKVVKELSNLLDLRLEIDLDNLKSSEISFGLCL